MSFYSSNWNSSKRKNHLQNNRLWSKSEEAGRGVAGGSHPELTEESSQVLAICSPPTNYPADLPVTLPSSETIPIRMTVSSVTSLPCRPAQVRVSRAKGVPFWSLQTQETNPGTEPGAEEYHSLARPLAAALPCSTKPGFICQAARGRAS